jgi:hypothetical protein
MTGEFQISVKPNPKACKINFIRNYIRKTSVRSLYLEWEVQGVYDEC